MEIIKKTRKLGNSAGVLLPKHWLGYEVKVTVVKKPRNIRKEALKYLESYLYDILGIFLCGSYARKEEDLKSDINILAISSSINKQITIDKYTILIIPLKKIKLSLPASVPFYMMLKESKPLLNRLLLHDLRKIKLTKQAVEKYSLNIKKSLSHLKQPDETTPQENIINIIKEIYILNCIINNKNYKKRDIFAWLSLQNSKLARKIFLIYNSTRKNKKIKIKKGDLNQILIFLTTLLSDLNSKI